MDETPTLLAAFGAGFCSLISPGIAPLLPGFAGFLRGRGLGHLLACLLGFSLGCDLSLLAFGLAYLAIRRRLQTTRPQARLVDVISGGLVAVTGLLIFTGAFSIVAAALSEYLPLF